MSTTEGMPTKTQGPPSSTFSFKAPFPASSTSAISHLKQRRVSLALPSSPRLVQAWSFRDDTILDSHVAQASLVARGEKKGKIRKIETAVEDEDGASGSGAMNMQEKKPRKKWSEEETNMLVAGCNKHGVGNWKTILSDTALKFDNRTPVDLKDRFRTYFPDAYKQHYPNARTHLSSKVRSTLPDGSSLFEKTRSKRRRPFTEEEDRALKAGYEKYGTVWATIVKDPVFQEQHRRSTDLRDRFRNAFPDLYQAAGYKPRGTTKKKSLIDGPKTPVRAATDDQLSMSTTGPVRSRRRAQTSQGLLRGGTKSVPQSAAVSEDEDSSGGEEEVDLSAPAGPIHTPIFVENVSTSTTRADKKIPAFLSSSKAFIMPDDDEMEMVTLDDLSDPLSIPDIMNSQTQSELEESQTWSSGLDTPTHSHHTWSTAAGSPTSSHLSADLLMNHSSQSSPFQPRSDTISLGVGSSMIGKSAWGAQDWFSANPRLDPGSSNSPASPFSFHHHLNHGVLDRYDLFPATMPHDFSSEVGVGDSHSTFSDDMFPPNGFRGFTHHSNYAGDLIFGARTHQPQQSFYGTADFATGFGGLGLGLTPAVQNSIHPMQLHTPALPGIDEIELTGITLNDRVDSAHDHDSMEEIPVVLDRSRQPTQEQHKDEPEDSALMCGLDDIVDLSPDSLHSTPPGTPLFQPRPVRHSSGSAFQHYSSIHGSVHSRSISVPPTEARAAPRPVQTNHSNSFPLTRSSQFHPSVQQPSQNPNKQQHINGDTAAKVASPVPTAAMYPSNVLMPPSSVDLWNRTLGGGSPGDLYDLPFLDLHYYPHSTTSSHAPNGSGHTHQMSLESTMGQALALDLAQSAASSSSLRSLGIPASLRQHIPQTQIDGGLGIELGIGIDVGQGVNVFGNKMNAGTERRMMLGGGHHRGQSAVCPQDLMLRSGDNKRKRASWDGGHG